MRVNEKIIGSNPKPYYLEISNSIFLSTELSSHGYNLIIINSNK